MSASDVPGTSRRGFMQASVGGLAAAGVAGLVAACTGASQSVVGPARGTLPGRELADTVVAAFKTHRLVGLGEAHGLQNHHDALTLLLTDPRLPGLVDDIVVEYGTNYTAIIIPLGILCIIGLVVAVVVASYFRLQGHRSPGDRADSRMERPAS